MNRFLCGLCALLLASCARKEPDMAPLPPVTRVAAKTVAVRRPYAESKKSITDAAHVARIVAAVDGQSSGWKSVPDGASSSGGAVELVFYAGDKAVREFNISPGLVSGSMGHAWNLTAFDKSAAGATVWVVKEVPDEQIDALLAAVGPLEPPAPRPKKKP